MDQQIAQAAKYIHADILSPAAISDTSAAADPTQQGYAPFTTKVCLSLQSDGASPLTVYAGYD